MPGQPKPAPEAPPGDEPKPAHQTPEPGRDTSQRASAEAAGSKKPEPRAPIAAAPQQLFGEKGQLVFKNDFELSLGHTTGEPTTFGVVIRPSLDYFVMAGFSLGLALNFSHEQQAEDIAGLSSTDKLETKTDSYGIGLDAGGNVRLSELFSIWFQGFLGVLPRARSFPARAVSGRPDRGIRAQERNRSRHRSLCSAPDPSRRALLFRHRSAASLRSSVVAGFDHT